MEHSKAYKDLFEFLENCKGPATRWIESLPLYKCPYCGEETIFKSGCSECEFKDEEQEKN